MDAVMVSIESAARLMDLSESTIRRMVADGRLPTVRIGRSVRIRVHVLHDLALREITHDEGRS